MAFLEFIKACIRIAIMSCIGSMILTLFVYSIIGIIGFVARIGRR